MTKLELAATHIEARAELLRIGEEKGAILITVDKDLTPSYTLYAAGDNRQRLIMIGALHEVLGLLLGGTEEADEAFDTIPGVQ